MEQYKKMVEVKDDDGLIKKQCLVSLEPWEFETSTGLKQGVNLVIKTSKSSKQSSVYLDVSNEEIEEAIAGAYRAYKGNQKED